MENSGQREMTEVWEKGEKDHKSDYYFLSYKDNYVPFDFCKDNQKIYDLEYNDSITRKVTDRDITELRRVLTQGSNPYTGFSYEWRYVKTRTKRVVIQDEN